MISKYVKILDDYFLGIKIYVKFNSAVAYTLPLWSLFEQILI